MKCLNKVLIFYLYFYRVYDQVKFVTELKKLMNENGKN